MIHEYEPRRHKDKLWSIETKTPALEDELNHFFKRPMPINLREERLAQRLLDIPDQGVEWLVAFEKFLRQTKNLSIMLQRDPGEAEHRIARRIRKVAFAALSTVAFDQVLETILPRLENGEPLSPNLDIRPYHITREDIKPGKGPFKGNAAAFVRSMCDILRQGWEETLANITDPHHYYYPLWDCFEVAHSAHMRSIHRSDLSAETQCLSIAEDNAIVALELLTNLRAEYTEGCAKLGMKPTAYGATLRALRSADRLGWAASGNANAIGKVVASDRLAEYFGELEACPASELAIRFPHRKRLVVPVEDSRLYTYSHASVQKGPWPIGGPCPAVPWLESPNPRPVIRFDNYITDFRRNFADNLKGMPHELDQTLFIRATLLMSIAALVGYETIFQEWEY